MLFAEFDWNRVLTSALIGGVVGGAVWMVKKLSGGGKSGRDS